MFCLLALIVFSILGLFSVTHRKLAKEAFACVFRRVTLRPCNTGFKEKMKAELVGKVLLRSVWAARIVNKNFELLAWVFFIVSVVSTIWMVWGVYNYYVYGSCNGLNQAGFCAFDPRGANNQVSSIDSKCYLKPPTEKDVTLKGMDLSLFPARMINAKDTVVVIGCYLCDYTRKAYPLIQEFLKNNKVNYIFAHFPTKVQATYLTGYIDCAYQQNQDKYWKLNDQLFASSKKDVANPAYTQSLMSKDGFDMNKVNACVANPKTKALVNKQVEMLRKTGIYGTPTVFINGKALVGPKPYRVYQFALKRFWFW